MKKEDKKKKKPQIDMYLAQFHQITMALWSRQFHFTKPHPSYLVPRSCFGIYYYIIFLNVFSLLQGIEHTHSFTLLLLEYSWSSSRPYSICPQKNVKMTNSEDLKQSDSNINQVQSIGHFDIRTYKIKQKINKLCFQIYDK